jgi:CRP-like cAMP-binding protein
MLAEDRRVGSLERLLHLRRAPFLGTLDPRQLAVVADASRPRVFKRGEALLREGEQPGASYVVAEGRVRLTQEGRPMAFAEAGASLGALGILARAPAPVTATAEVDTLTLELDADDYGDMLEDHFSILRHLLREIAGKVVDGWSQLPAGTPPLVGDVPRVTTRVVQDLDLVERIFFLRQVAPFDRSSINALAELARGLSEAHFAAGERLWSEGDPGRYVILLVAGRVDCRADRGLHYKAQPGAGLGALEAMAGRPRFYDATAAGPVTGLVGEIETAFDVFEDNLGMGLDFLTFLSRWLMALMERAAREAPEHFRALAALDFSRAVETDVADVRPLA